MTASLGPLGALGPEAVIPLRAGSVRIARLDLDQPTGDGRWVEVGSAIGGLTLEPVLEAAAHHYAETMALPVGGTITVAFAPSRAMVELLFGWSATVSRTRVRSLTRRRYRARARRGRR